MAVLIITVDISSVLLVVLALVRTAVYTAYTYAWDSGRENKRAEELPEQPRPQARRGDSRKRVAYNEHGGEEREMDVMILAPPRSECDCPIPADTSQHGRVEDDLSGDRPDTKNTTDTPQGRPAQNQVSQSECGGWKGGAPGSARASLQSPSYPFEMLAALRVVLRDPTLELREVCGLGRETTRQEHYSSMEQHLKTCKKDGTLIWFTGHGQRGTGDWVFLDGVVTFMDVFGLYQNYFMGRKLTIICDCCYSGHWVEKLAMKLDEYGIPPCGHRAKALDIKLRIVASCQKDQQCREESFKKTLCLSEDGTITFPREVRLSDNQTTAHIDTTEIRCSSGVHETCSVATGKKWKMS